VLRAGGARNDESRVIPREGVERSERNRDADADQRNHRVIPREGVERRHQDVHAEETRDQGDPERGS